MKIKIIIPLIMVVCMAFEAYSGNLPSNVQKCKFGDNTCIGEKIMELFQKYPNGSPELGMPNVSALTLKNITVARATGNSAVQLNFRFLEFNVHGLENVKILRATGFGKEPQNVEIDAIVPVMKINGEYATKGKILILSLDGQGKGELELTNVKVKVNAKGRLEMRNGKNYVKIVKLKVILEPKKMFVRLENLVKNNKELSDTLNTVINENWADVWSELKDGINYAAMQIISNLMIDILNALSYDDFFASE